jgi:hypothetical protein
MLSTRSSDFAGVKDPESVSFRQAQERFNVEDPMKIPWVRFREAAVLLLVAEALENYWHDKG